jgi:hypothetical protein
MGRVVVLFGQKAGALLYEVSLVPGIQFVDTAFR